MPTMNVSTMPPIPASSASHDGRNEVPGQRLEQEQAGHRDEEDARRRSRTCGMPTCTSIANANMASTMHGERPRPGRQHGHARAGEHGAHRADRPGDADAGGEELEHDQREAGQQQQVGHGRAGDGVEQLVDERELGEADRGDRVEPGRAVVEHDEVGGRRGPRRSPRSRRAPAPCSLTVGMPSSSIRCLKMSSDRASDSPTDPLRRRSSATPKSTSTPGGVERHADVADAGAGRHAGDVGDGQDLRGRAVEPGTGRPDPDADRHRCVGDQLEQVLDLVVGDHRARLLTWRMSACEPCSSRHVDRGLDLVEQDRVEQAADLQHVDPGHVDARVVVDRVVGRVDRVRRSSCRSGVVILVRALSSPAA